MLNLMIIIILVTILFVNIILTIRKRIQNGDSNIDSVIEIDNNGKKQYIIIYRLLKSSKVSYEDYDKLVRGILTLTNKLESKIIISSMVSRKGYNTYVVIMSSNPQAVERDAQLLSKIVASITTNIKLSLVKKANISEFYLVPLVKSLTTTFHVKEPIAPPTAIHYKLTKDKPLLNIINDKIPLDIKSCSKSFSIGTLINTTAEAEAILGIEDLFRHVCVIGSTGSGKTTTTKRIIYEILRTTNDVNIIVFDWHSEYHHLASIIKKINIKYKMFTPGIPSNSNVPIPLITCGGDIESNIAILETVLDLTPPQTSVLIDLVDKLCKEHLEVATSKLLDLLNSRRKTVSSRSEIEVLSALHRKIFTLVWGQGQILFNRIKGTSISELLTQRLSIVDLSHIINPRIRVLYAMLMLKRIYEEKISNKTNKNLVVVLEELHNYHKQYGVISNIISESRKYNLGLILLNQDMSNLTPQILSNVNTKIIHRLTNPAESRYISEVLGKELGYIAMNLDVGEAIIIGGPYVEPVIVKIHGFN